jgi:putative transposase
MAMEHRATGWLDDLHHARLRECLVHALGRHQLVCPVYCLMPDHAHFVWMGWDDRSEQKLAARHLREAWNHELRKSGCGLQLQAHDHVLRENERERGAFTAVADYVLENPVRAGLVRDWPAYPFSGSIVPGYPVIDPREKDFWDRFWRIFARLLDGKG